jgi:hypothetical protein
MSFRSLRHKDLSVRINSSRPIFSPRSYLGPLENPTAEQSAKLDSLFSEIEQESNQIQSLSNEIQFLSKEIISQAQNSREAAAHPFRVPESAAQILERIIKKACPQTQALTYEEHRNEHRVMTLGQALHMIRREKEEAIKTRTEATQKLAAEKAKREVQELARRAAEKEANEKKEMSSAISFVIAMKMPKENPNQPLSPEELARKKLLEEWNSGHHLIPASLKDEALKLYQNHLAEKARSAEQLILSGWQ